MITVIVVLTVYAALVTGGVYLAWRMMRCRNREQQP